MKKTIFTLALLIHFTATSVFAQEVKFEDVQNATVTSGQFTSYIAKDGSTYKVGDKVSFGTPSGVNGKFVTITNMDIAGNVFPVGAGAINTVAEIKKIRIAGNKRSGYKVAFQTKGVTGIDNYFFFLEDAIQVGEIKSFGMTSDQALAALKKAKDKLDLGLITQEEYDKTKQELSKYIK
jgi:hypothetical protein